MRVIYTAQEYGLIIDTLKRAPLTFTLVERVRIVNRTSGNRKNRMKKYLIKLLLFYILFNYYYYLFIIIFFKFNFSTCLKENRKYISDASQKGSRFLFRNQHANHAQRSIQFADTHSTDDCS